MFDPNNQAQQQPQFRTATQQQPPPQQVPHTVQHPAQQGLLNVPFEKQRTFYFKFISSLDGQTYEGQFTCKKLSVRDLAQMGVRKVQLNGGFHYDDKNPGCGIEEHIDGMNAMIAHLETALIQVPIWFNIDQVYDPQLLQEIYMKVVEFENSFFRPKGAALQPGPSSQGSSGTTGQGSDTAGHVAPLGGGQVPSSLDP